jgi:hypothetical protein
MGEACSRERQINNAYKTLAGNHGGKKPHARRRRRWVGIKMDLKEIRWKVTDWIHLGQDRGHCSETPSSIDGREFLSLNDCFLLMKKFTLLTGTVRFYSQNVACIPFSFMRAYHSEFWDG